jgi:hypothetical protein
MSSVSEVKPKEYTLDEVKNHTTADNCWLIIGNESNGACVCLFAVCVYAFVGVIRVLQESRAEFTLSLIAKPIHSRC